MLIRLSAAALLFAVLAIPPAMAKDASHGGRSKCLCDQVNATGFLWRGLYGPAPACMPAQDCMKQGNSCVGSCKKVKRTPWHEVRPY